MYFSNRYVHIIWLDQPDVFVVLISYLITKMNKIGGYCLEKSFKTFYIANRLGLFCNVPNLLFRPNASFQFSKLKSTYKKASLHNHELYEWQMVVGKGHLELATIIYGVIVKT